MTMVKAALAMATRGMQVFPCLPHGKKPATKHGFQDATLNPQQIEAWWRSWPSCNIGVATGAPSGVFVIDVDKGEKEMRRLEAQHGALPPTVESTTPNGRHIFFRYPGWPVKCSQNEFAPGIDVRADGGYVVVPPSVHPSGRRYYWRIDAANAFADAPEWVLDRLRATSASTAHPTPALELRQILRDGVDEGQRNKSVARLAGHLLRRYVDPLVVLDFMIIWDEARCRPPLGAREVTHIVDSIAKREIARRATHGR
jgi:hypothetical protein